jgi:hypothetical protein
MDGKAWKGQTLLPNTNIVNYDRKSFATLGPGDANSLDWWLPKSFDLAFWDLCRSLGATTQSITTLSITPFSTTMNKSRHSAQWHLMQNDVMVNDLYAEWHLCWESKVSSTCWVSLCWVLLCWMSWRPSLDFAHCSLSLCQSANGDIQGPLL